MEDNQEKQINEKDSMASVDLDQIRKERSKPRSIIDADSLHPVEVKSTAHIERAKAEKEHRETVKTAGAAAADVFDWLESIMIGILLIILIFTFLVRVNTVSGKSMFPTLVDGEKLLVSDMFYTPGYNDIVIIQAARLPNENGEMGKPIVKRIVGMPGDTIRIDFAAGIVYRNGEALEITVDPEDGMLREDGHIINTPTTEPEDMSNDEVVVPEDCYFVMGDNRNNSTDSRSESVGFVHKNYIAGRAFMAVFPFDKFGLL